MAAKFWIDDMVSDHAKALGAFTKEAKDTKDSKFQASVIKGETPSQRTRHGLRPEKEAVVSVIR